MNFSNDDVGKRVSFDIYGASIIGGDYKNAELLLTGSAAAFTEYSPKNKHDMLYSTLPDPKPQSHTEYLYYLFSLANGRRALVGDAWIIPSSIIRGSSNKLLIEIDGANVSDIGKIKNLLVKEGYKVTKSSIESN